MNFSDAEQGSVILNGSTQQAGTTVSLSDGEGNCIFSKVVSKSYSSVLISVPSLAKGESYVLKAGTISNTVTLTSLIYGSGSGM